MFCNHVISANFVIATSFFWVLLLLQVKCLWKFLYIPLRCHKLHSGCRVPYSSTAAAAHSGRVSGELNTHLISNWIFNQPVDSLKWRFANPHSFPALIPTPGPLSSSSDGILKHFETFVPSPYFKKLKQHQKMARSWWVCPLTVPAEF